MNFRQMAAYVPEGSVGQARIQHFEVSEQEASLSKLRATINPHRPDDSVREGKYVKLYVGQTLMMSDTQMEQKTNVSVIRNASGKVLIAGLGVGLILLPILEKAEVIEVTVIEKYPEVVELVEPHVRKAAGAYADKLKVVTADILTWKPPKGERWNTIYFDIWPEICPDNLEEMATLHRRFGRRKAPGGWMDSWQRYELLYLRSRERSRGGWY